MSQKGSGKRIVTALAIGAAAVSAAVAMRKKRPGKQRERLRYHGDRQVYFIGGGLASLAGAAYLVRDLGFDGRHIHILEGTHALGGSNDGGGDAINGFVIRGGRMLNEETYENFWELMDSIPSLEMPGKSVTEEILNFDRLHPTRAQARLIDKGGRIVDVSGMGFSQEDRLALAKLMVTPEESLDDKTIEEWFSHTPHFFTTNFWYMWQTTFAFQRWSSLFEFKRYMERMIFEFPRIETLEGVTRTRYNQYESVILPLKEYLSRARVCFAVHSVVKDIEFAQPGRLTATAIRIGCAAGDKVIHLRPSDICIVTNGCMTDNAALGDYDTPPEYLPQDPMSGELWERIVSKRPKLGNPQPFFNHPEKTNWVSFTVTLKGEALLKRIEQFSGNIPGSGALMTFKDSNWLMSIVVAAQPHFKNQPPDTTVFWGYGLYTERMGDFVKKPMRDCTGKEIFLELLHHLHMEQEAERLLPTVINVIPCMMPYINAQFQPRKKMDRPPVVPRGSVNFAMIGQFVEIPEDMVFTEEYSVRSARIAVYELFGYKDKPVCPVTPYKTDGKVLFNALKAAYR